MIKSGDKIDMRGAGAPVMYEISRHMKEIAELPSEAPKDVQGITLVEFPEKGGVLAYMSEMPYPYKGFPFFEFVDKVDVLKKISRSVLSGLYHQLKRKKLLLLTLLPAVWLVKPLMRMYLYVVYRQIDRFKLKREMYSDAVREIYRAFTGTTEFHQMFRDALCMILEMDNAYRYRFQDIIVNVDKTALLKNPRKELIRLLEILSQRENTQDIKDTWFLMKLTLNLYLVSDKELREYLKNSIFGLNLYDVALKIEDKCFAAGRKDYTFGFMLKHDKDGDECLKFYKDKDEWTAEKTKIQDASTKEHQELFKRHEIEQKLIAKKTTDEEAEKIHAEVKEKVTKLYQKRDGKIQEIVEGTSREEKAVYASYLTEDQRKLADFQQTEIDAMDKKWTEELIKAEDNYKLKCQPPNSI